MSDSKLKSTPPGSLQQPCSATWYPMNREQLDTWRGYYPHLRLVTDEQVNQYRAEIEAAWKSPNAKLRDAGESGVE
jgi:hypothetical protein